MTDNCDKTYPKLPNAPGVNNIISHGTEICDRYGNRWFYDAGQDGWVSKGIIEPPAQVTEQQAGLISPDVFEKLEKLKVLVDSGHNFSPLKLAPATDAYWYYFRSSDKQYRFIAEGSDCLRIEVDRTRLFTNLLKQRCKGDRGDKGCKGEVGNSGVPAPAENCYSPSSITQTRIDFAIYVPLPLGTDGSGARIIVDRTPEISVRLYRVDAEYLNIEDCIQQQQQQLNVVSQNLSSNEIELSKFKLALQKLQNTSMGVQNASGSACNIPLSNVVIYDDDVRIAAYPSVDVWYNTDGDGISDVTVQHATGIPLDVEATASSIQYDPATGVICGTFVLESETWEEQAELWCIRSSQRGIDGKRGEPGNCYVDIKECFIDSTNIIASCPIVNVRVDCDEDVLYTQCAELLVDEICDENIRLIAGADDLTGSPIRSSFASAEMTLDECKKIYSKNLEIEEEERPELELLAWEPQPGCVTQRHFNRHKFDWIPTTADGDTWCDFNGEQPSLYPGVIQTQSEPEQDNCCEDDWFWCPSVQEGSCPPVSPVPSASASAASFDQQAIGAGFKNWSLNTK